MMEQRNLILAIVLSVTILLGFQFMFEQPRMEKERAAREAGRLAPITDGVDVMGPAEPPISVVRGRWRRRFLVRADLAVDISSYMAAWRARLKVPAAKRVAIDIEPYSFL